MWVGWWGLTTAQWAPYPLQVEDELLGTEDIDGSGSEMGEDDHSPIDTPSPSSSPTEDRKSNGSAVMERGGAYALEPQYTPIKSKVGMSKPQLGSKGAGPAMNR